jgi:peptidoglycan/LPS O-acetylase OafA/YrhL
MNPQEHVRVLDGWRGISILLVLAAHLLPLGPSRDWNLNVQVGVAGMVIFFVLSGFLITSILLKEEAIGDFLARRAFRVLPLAWLYLVIALAIDGASLKAWLAHYFFYANLPPQDLLPLTAHMWSVCVEMQFYLGIAALAAAFGPRGLLLLPVLCIAFSGIRAWNGVYASSITYFRIDELLAGCILALVYHGRMGAPLLRYLRAVPQWPLLLLLFLSCLDTAWLPYFRPYLAAALVGTTILNRDTLLVRLLSKRPLIYVAGISYALYVLHPLLAGSWLGSGDILEKYAKRPLLFAVLFGLAHASTYYYERRWIAFGKRVALRFAPASR